MDSNIIFIQCCRIIVVHVHGNILVQNSSSVPQRGKRNQPGSNSKMADKHSCECSKTACMSVL